MSRGGTISVSRPVHLIEQEAAAQLKKEKEEALAAERAAAAAKATPDYAANLGGTAAIKVFSHHLSALVDISCAMSCLCKHTSDHQCSSICLCL